MANYIAIPINGIEKQKTLPTKTYAIDFDTGRIKGMVDGVEALHQAIRKALNTPRFKCLIYNNQYGSEVKQAIIAEDATPAYTQAEMPRIVKDALINDDRILSIDTDGFTFDFVDDGVYIDFSLESIYGSLNVKEVVKYV